MPLKNIVNRVFESEHKLFTEKLFQLFVVVVLSSFALPGYAEELSLLKDRCSAEKLTFVGSKDDVVLLRNDVKKLEIDAGRDGEILYYCGRYDVFVKCHERTTYIKVYWMKDGSIEIVCSK